MNRITWIFWIYLSVAWKLALLMLLCYQISNLTNLVLKHRNLLGQSKNIPHYDVHFRISAPHEALTHILNLFHRFRNSHFIG